MRPQNAARAAHRGDGGDPRNVVRCGKLNDRSNSKPCPADQSPAHDLFAAVAGSDASTALADALRAAIHKPARTARWLPFREGLAVVAERLWPTDAAPEPCHDYPRGLPDTLLFAPRVSQPSWPRFYRAEGARR